MQTVALKKVHVRLDAFEGPIALLYHLIETQALSITDIPIAELTDQYLDILEQEQNREMESLSEFLVLAATLLEIKSRMLLPYPKAEEKEEVDPREELVARLLEYKQYKEAAGLLKEREPIGAAMFYKAAEPAFLHLRKERHTPTPEECLEGISLSLLTEAFLAAMQRQISRIDPVRSTFRQVERDVFTIQDKMAYLRDFLILNRRTTFSAVFRLNAPKEEIVVTFLALLELIKQKEILISQEGAFGEIVMRRQEETA